MIKRYDLNKNWVFSLADSSNSVVAIPNKEIKSNKQFPAKVPGTIHTDLLNNKLIEDPFYSDNELRMGWISECDWVYETKFDFKTDIKNNIDLIFEGLDTICEIYLNDVKLGGSDNMFIKYRYNIKNLIKSSGNVLRIIFKSPVKYALDQEEKYGKLPVALSSSRVYIRKAQYSFGWDWGPSFLTAGIWRKVYLEEWVDAKIESVKFNTSKLGKNYSEVEVVVGITGHKFNKKSLQLSLSNGNDLYEKKIPIQRLTICKISFRIKDPKLWWPNGAGEQNLCTLNVKIVDDNNFILDEVVKNVGVRKIELILQDKKNSTFKFRINHKDVFCKGVNWIPADSFLPRVTGKKYSELLSLARQANINMVRVWGGGTYESDEFYNLCDKIGLLVWQDFMFACGSYPENDDFLANIEEEVTQNVLRLQYHACIALWCGNNENEWIWFQERKSSYKKMPGYKIYHNIIPAILKQIDPERPYWPSSPFGNDDDPNSFNSGNTHQWKIWSMWADYNNVKEDRSLFVTEFGFQGPANKDTFEKFLPIENRNISNRVFEHHNKQIEGPERIIKFLSSHLPIKTGWDDYLYLTQLNQAFALKTCLEHWRTNGRTNGSIIWQLNDCWPVTSWAIIDSDIKPKIAYHFVKDTFALQLLYFKDEGGEIKVILLNEDKIKIKGILRLTVVSTVSGEIVDDNSYKVNVSRIEYTEIRSVFRKNLPPNENWILLATLYNKLNEIMCRNYFLTKPWKHVELKEVEVNLEMANKNDSSELLIKSDHPAFFIDLYNPGMIFSDRGFIILPGEQIKLKTIGEQPKSLKKEDIKVFSLNNYLSD